MANNLAIGPATLGAPYEVKASFTGSGASGGDWVTTRKYIILAAGWRDKDETDGFFFQPFNYVQDAWGVDSATAPNYETGAWNILNTTAGKVLTVSWALPQHCGRIDHISLYQMRGSTYTIATATAGTPGTFTIAGNVTAYLPVNATFTIIGSTGNNGNYTVTGSSFGGGVTTITVANVPDGTDDGTIVPDITESQFLLAAFTKILPDPADMTLLNGEIPPYATSATVKSAAAVTRKRRLPILSGVVGTKTITVPGNVSVSLPGSVNDLPGGVSGAAGFIADDGAGGTATGTVTSATRSIAAGEGEITTIVLSTFGTMSAIADAGYFEYSVGPVKLFNSEGYIWQSSVRTVADLPFQTREKHGLDYRGEYTPRAFSGGGDIEKLSVSCAYPGVTVADHHDVNKAVKLGLRVQVSINQDTDVTPFLGSVSGYIRETNDLSLRQMHDTGRRVVYDFLPDQQHYLWDDDGFYAVTVVSSGIPGTGFFAIDGDHSRLFQVGQAFLHYGPTSTDNNGLFRASDVTYDTASDTTWIYVTNKTIIADASPDSWLQRVAL